jgi:hypothetical protein
MGEEAEAGRRKDKVSQRRRCTAAGMRRTLAGRLVARPDETNDKVAVRLQALLLLR